jgi:hypothetical protein
MELVVDNQDEYHILEDCADSHHFYLTQELSLVHHCRQGSHVVEVHDPKTPFDYHKRDDCKFRPPWVESAHIKPLLIIDDYKSQMVRVFTSANPLKRACS